MSVTSSSSPPPLSSYSYPSRFLPVDPRLYCETINELHSYLTSCKRGYLTQAELFRYYRQRHGNAEIPYRPLGYRSLLDLLSSDQRLFAVDLRREPAHIYSAVKLRQEKKREQRQGSTTFTRQHHSTNTLAEQPEPFPSNDYAFFDHHVPTNKQESNASPPSNDDDEEGMFHPSEAARPLTPIRSNPFEKKLWHTPELDPSKASNENQFTAGEESEGEKIPFFPFPTVQHSDERYQSLANGNEDYQLMKRSLLKQDPSIISCSANLLNRSISTSTTSLSNCKCSPSINVSKVFLFLFISALIVFIPLYKTCFI